jgi:hypothetical protein
MVSTEKLKEWVRLRRQQHLLEEELKDVKEDAENLSFLLIDQFMSDGVDSMKVEGVTIYVQEKKMAGIAYLPEESTDQGYDRACDMLDRIGMGELVHRRFLVPTLNKWVNDNKDAIPAEFEGVIRIETKHVLVPRGVKTKSYIDSEVNQHDQEEAAVADIG